MNEVDVLTAFIEEGYQISPEAVELICSQKNAESLVRNVLDNIDISVFVVGLEHINLDNLDSNSDPDFCVGSTEKSVSFIENENQSLNSFGKISDFDNTQDNLTLNKTDVDYSFDKNPVSIISDITDNSTCVGEYIEFIQFFRNRYSKLSEIIRSRVNARPIESLTRNRSPGMRGNSERGEISVIGMISEIKTTTNGHKIVEIEDPTGIFSVLVRMADKELFEQATHFVLDEVVGFTGTLTNDGKLMIVQKIILPDLPNISAKKFGSFGKAVLISDVHVGSTTFLKDEWERFLDFLKGDTDNEELLSISKEIRYVVVAGDLVDGVGIYPGQDLELDILDVYDQYKKAAEYFAEIPRHIKIIISPGNHDAVRQAEPQPKLPECIRKDFSDNVVFVGNPAMVDLDGVKIMMYHGRSIDDLVASVPGVSYHEPTKAMVEMMKFRHLSPMYGSRVSIAPEKTDHFVINQIPDILHCGHVHTVGVEWYKNVLLINSGTWQDQTDFQKRVNVVPTPAQVPVVDLATFRTTILRFDE
jgi:DNA polymerase II small subunit